MDWGLGATVAQPEDTVSDPNALSLGQHFATYAEFKAAMCRWAVTAHFETRYEKSEKAVNVVTRSQGMYIPCTCNVQAGAWVRSDYQAGFRAHCWYWYSGSQHKGVDLHFG